MSAFIGSAALQLPFRLRSLVNRLKRSAVFTPLDVPQCQFEPRDGHSEDRFFEYVHTTPRGEAVKPKRKSASYCGACSLNSANPSAVTILMAAGSV